MIVTVVGIVTIFVLTIVDVIIDGVAVDGITIVVVIGKGIETVSVYVIVSSFFIKPVLLTYEITDAPITMPITIPTKKWVSCLFKISPG